jgi:hypothetical protein
LLSGANQLQDITNEPKFSDLLGLSWQQIQAAFPSRLQQLADSTYEQVRCSQAQDDVMAAFGVTDEKQTVATNMTAEQRLHCLQSVMNDRYGRAKFSVFVVLFSFVS